MYARFLHGKSSKQIALPITAAQLPLTVSLRPTLPPSHLIASNSEISPLPACLPCRYSPNRRHFSSKITRCYVPPRPDRRDNSQQYLQGATMERAKGFTLIELLITIVIIAVLAAIGYPSYTSHVAKSRRADAQQFMMQMDTRQKQILIEQRAYATAPNALNVASEGFSCSASRCSNQFYDITFDPAVDNTATPPSYTLCATPKSAQTNDGVLKLTSDGAKQRLTGTTSCSGGTANPW